MDLVGLQVEMDILKNQRALHRSKKRRCLHSTLLFGSKNASTGLPKFARCSRKLFTPRNSRVHFHSRDTASHSPQARPSHNCTLSRVAQPIRLCHRK